MAQNVVRVWRKSKIDKERLGKTGHIASWTEVFVAPPKFDALTPYVIVLVALEHGGYTYGELVDFERSQVEIGQPVQSVLRIIGKTDPEAVVEYGVKFKPV